MGNAYVLFIVFLIILNRIDKWAEICRSKKEKENIRWYWEYQ